MTLTREQCQEMTNGPGKFEGEPIYSPYYYDLMLSGCQDETVYEGDLGMIDFFKVCREDVAIFPELKDVYGISVSNDDNGFVYCGTLTEKEAKDLLSP